MRAIAGRIPHQFEIIMIGISFLLPESFNETTKSKIRIVYFWKVLESQQLRLSIFQNKKKFELQTVN